MENDQPIPFLKAIVFLRKANQLSQENLRNDSNPALTVEAGLPYYGFIGDLPERRSASRTA